MHWCMCVPVFRTLTICRNVLLPSVYLDNTKLNAKTHFAEFCSLLAIENVQK